MRSPLPRASVGVLPTLGDPRPTLRRRGLGLVRTDSQVAPLGAGDQLVGAFSSGMKPDFMPK